MNDSEAEESVYLVHKTGQFLVLERERERRREKMASFLNNRTISPNLLSTPNKNNTNPHFKASSTSLYFRVP